MRVLVTGATGFLGGAVARRLARDGHDVTASGRSVRAGAVLQADGLRFVAADLTDRRAVDTLVDGHDAVVHSAALSTPWGRRADFVAANVHAVDHVLAACRRHRVRRLVHLSSPSVHSSGTPRVGIREDAPWPALALNAYIETKREGERRVARSEVPHVILRPRGMFGPGDTSVLPRIIGALERRAFPLIGDGSQLVELTWIDNAVDAVERALVVPDVDGRVYHVTNGEPRPLRALLERLCARLDLPLPHRRVPYRVAFAAAAAVERVHRAVPRLGEPTLTRYGVTIVGLTSTLDISALRDDLGWAPAVPLDEGIDRFCAWWEAR